MADGAFVFGAPLSGNGRFHKSLDSVPRFFYHSEVYSIV